MMDEKNRYHASFILTKETKETIEKLQDKIGEELNMNIKKSDVINMSIRAFGVSKNL